MKKSSEITVKSETASGHGKAIKQLSKFAACLIGATSLCLYAYTATVDSLVQDTKVPASYKWFLLKHVPGPRVIFESGSNSHHAINTDVLGQALGMTAINIADNGGYALEDKITRLETYARPGDVIVLPLEWTFYHREKLTDNYVDTLFTQNRDYYRNLPPIKRVSRALSLPPEKVIAQVLARKDRPKPETESPAKALFVSALTQPTGHQSRKVSSGPGAGVAEQSCDDYVLGKGPERNSLSLGANIKPALRRLAALNARGIDIHFAWPVLAGNGCMSDRAYVTGFRAQIEEAVNAAGFEFLGAPGQSLYGQNVQDDSPYHITTEGADIHTAQMVRFLKSQGHGKSAAPLDIKTFARHRLLELELAQAAKITQAALPMDRPMAMDDPDMRRHVEFTAGWWAFEPYGRWMRDNRAMFRVTLPKDMPENSVLKIQGTTKSGRLERVNVSVSGELIRSGLFGEGAPLLLSAGDLPAGEALSIFIDLPDAAIPQSPLERGENEDARSMTLHIQSLTLSAPGSPAVRPALPVKPPVPSGVVAAAPQVMMTAARAISQGAAPGAGMCKMTGETFSPLTAQIQFKSGWWEQEVFGRWMKGDEANLIIDLPTGQAQKTAGRYALSLKGDFFMGRAQAVSLLINGANVGSLKETEEGVLTALFRLQKPADDLSVTLRLSDPEALSPKELGLSDDDRTLTYFLKSVSLTNA